MYPRILIIDDDDVWRGVLARALREAGYAVDEAENGEIGLAACAANKFGLVITDIFMPERDGLELLAALKKEPDRPKILAMSGSHVHGRLDFAEVARRLGADKALKKPFGMEVLRSAVRELVGNG